MFNHKQQMSGKNNKRKSNRYSVLMLALIFIGFATYGTYAYFTESTSIKSDITLQAGTVELQNDKNEEWEYTTWDDQSVSRDLTMENKEAKNLQPGDAFQKTVTVTYTGSLAARISINNIEELKTEINQQGYDSAVTVKVGNLDLTANSFSDIEVKEDEKIEISIKIGLAPKTEIAEKYDEENSRNKGQGLSLNDILTDITVTASQITGK